MQFCLFNRYVIIADNTFNAKHNSVIPFQLIRSQMQYDVCVLFLLFCLAFFIALRAKSWNLQKALLGRVTQCKIVCKTYFRLAKRIRVVAVA